MFDVFIGVGCREVPDWGNWLEVIPELGQPDFHPRLLHPAQGFLGLNLDQSIATELLEFLGKFGGKGFVMPIRYRDPQPPEEKYVTASYDIYVSDECEEIPDWGNWAEKIPMLCHPEFQARLKKSGLRFLGLNLPLSQALELLQFIKKYTKWGLAIPAQYREPKISRAEADRIGTVELQRIQQTKPDRVYGPIGFDGESHMWWTYYSLLPELKNLYPNAIFTYVDKIDGHIWTSEEMESFWNSTGQCR
ncbi:MAG: hypothetical protein K1Y36_22325 [Blastocatellia bacterium]|nr:hypothetical protein [Blastocatellia bacterium]